MCIICKLWDSKRITTEEAKKALFEVAQEDDADMEHLQKVWVDLAETEEK